MKDFSEQSLQSGYYKNRDPTRRDSLLKRLQQLMDDHPDRIYIGIPCSTRSPPLGPDLRPMIGPLPPVEDSERLTDLQVFIKCSAPKLVSCDHWSQSDSTVYTLWSLLESERNYYRLEIN